MPRRILGPALVSLATLLAAPHAFAQVNAEALRTTLKANPKFLSLEGALVGHAGNTQTLTFSGSAFAGIHYGHSVFFAKASADYGQAMQVTNVARWMNHARYNYEFSERFALEIFAQVQHDRFRRIEVRDLYGAGVRYGIYTDKDNDIFLGTTYMFEHEAVSVISDGSALNGQGGENNVWNRNSTYFGLNAKLSPLVEGASTTYIQPRFDRPKDYRVLSESYLSVQITKVLSAKVSGSLWYDSEPPLGVKTFDLEVKNSLVVKLN